MAIPKGWTELDLDIEGILAYQSEDGLLWLGIDPSNNFGRTKEGTGPNVNCGGTKGYRGVAGGTLKGHKVNLHLIRKPKAGE